MEKLLIITPHMSTGGCPQFVLKRIELLKDIFDIYCIEYSFLSSEYVVQRNKVIDLLGDKFLPLYNDEKIFIDFLNQIDPDIVFIEEFSETFINLEVCKFLYRKNRNYKILECTHGSEDKSPIKKFLPDKFIFVSQWSKKMYQHFGVPIDVIEYPIDLKPVDIQSKVRLNFDTSYKHVLNVGLFTSGKNQKYAFEIAQKLNDQKIKFHFVGNLADNFKDYWSSLINNKPENCIIWGEKDNVEDFMMASDLFLFTSRFELNPLVLKEALCFNKKIFMFNLETYCDSYSDFETVSFLSGNIDIDTEKIKTYLQQC